MRILFLSRWFPFPPNNGSKLRIYNLLRYLSQNHSITLLSFYEPDEGNPDLSSASAVCQRIHTVPWKEFRPTHWRSLLGFFHPTPRWVLDTYSKEMEKMVRDCLQSQTYDVIIASQTIMAPYTRRIQGIPKILEEAEVGVFIQKARSSSLPRKIRHSLTWWKYRAYLQSLFHEFDRITVVSQEEKNYLSPLVPQKDRVVVISNGVSLKDYRSTVALPKPDTIIFTGSFRYSANHEAMAWFISQVLPLIQAQIPDVRLIITGDPAGKSIPSNPNVIQTGVVEDVREWIASAWVAIAPLQTGGGTRLKILEAMALHTPVVATTKGAEGLGAISHVHLLIADTPEDFANAVIQICQSPALREQIAHSAFEFVQNQYDWDMILPLYQQMLDEITSSKKEERG
ncbi:MULTISPECIES: glycosyltransferase [Anaerolinea]|uniref:glycosyltransferase n=1 Tax=Anaerolinea TaxID=233189 RepID=UPI002620FD3D|nr:glycosyltransferase [Anaerolinea thermophila]